MINKSRKTQKAISIMLILVMIILALPTLNAEGADASP